FEKSVTGPVFTLTAPAPTTNTATPAFNFIDASVAAGGANLVFANDDDAVASVTLPFNFALFRDIYLAGSPVWILTTVLGRRRNDLDLRPILGIVANRTCCDRRSPCGKGVRVPACGQRQRPVHGIGFCHRKRHRQSHDRSVRSRRRFTEIQHDHAWSKPTASPSGQ